MRWPFWKDFGSWEALHGLVRRASQTVGIMAYRKNGWVSIQPEAQSGVLVTKVVKAGKTLAINARTRDGGSIRVEVLHADGEPIPACCGDNAATFSGDATDITLAWSNGAVKELPSEPIRLRITIKNADLYALRW